MTVADVGGRRTVFVGAGEHVYALDAATGAERWRFAAGTGCRDAGRPAARALRVRRRAQPGRVDPARRRRHGVLRHGRQRRRHRQGRLLRGRRRRRHPGLVLRPRDRLGVPTRSRATTIRRFDGYHSEARARPARRLPRRPARAATTTGPRRAAATCGRRPPTTRSGASCTSAPATATPTTDPATPVPPPPMPRYDEALVALRIDGTPAWRGGPARSTTTTSPSARRRTSSRSTWAATPTEVVGIGGKDGTYYVLDRDGVNEDTGVAWNDADPSATPYWSTNVVPGGAIGGVIATASVDEAARRVFFSTGPGEDVVAPAAPHRPRARPRHRRGGLAEHRGHDLPGRRRQLRADEQRSRRRDRRQRDHAPPPPLRRRPTERSSSTATSASPARSRASARARRCSTAPSWWAPASAPVPAAAPAPATSPPTRRRRWWRSACPAPRAAPARRPVIVPGGVTVTEGTGGRTTAAVPLRLSFASSEPVTVEWETLDLPGYAGHTDVVAASGTVTFAPAADGGERRGGGAGRPARRARRVRRRPLPRPGRRHARGVLRARRGAHHRRRPAADGHPAPRRSPARATAPAASSGSRSCCRRPAGGPSRSAGTPRTAPPGHRATTPRRTGPSCSRPVRPVASW